MASNLAAELQVSRNDALLRLATRGARLYEQEQVIDARRAACWDAVVPGALDLESGGFPPPDEARSAVLHARDDSPSPAR